MSQEHDVNLIDIEENSEEFLRKFKSIVKKKLKQPLDLKKIYYEQMEHPP